MLLGRGQLDGKRIMAEKVLEAMWVPQFTKKKEGFGLGFFVDRIDDRSVIGHNGAVYGYATALIALPDDGLGVVVASSRDCTNAVTSHIAREALRVFLAEKLKKATPAIEETVPLSAEEVRLWSGHWRGGKKAFYLEEQGGKLYHWPAEGGASSEVRKLGKMLITDGPISRGLKMEPDGKSLRIDKTKYARSPDEKPAPCPAKWLGLIGEYGPDHLPTTILEKDGKLHALMEWFFLYPLTEQSDGSFLFPDNLGLYHGEAVRFTKDKAGKATSISVGPMKFARRKFPGAGRTFKIKPLRPVVDLTKDALKAKPPEERGLFNSPDLVELTKLDDSIKLDVRYATKDNFLDAPVYGQAKAFLQRPAAEALVRVNKALAKQGYGLLVHDGYRPWWVTKVFWDATPRDMKVFVADPSTGSRHNRGCAVDLTLYEKKSDKPVEMTGGYDEFSARSYAAYPGGTSLQRWHRDLLRHAMEAEGFSVYEAEWWHFDHRDWRKYRIGNVRFEDVK
jgi:serine beta-lactamase-like protein LACTB